MTMIKNIFIALTSACLLYACIGTDVSENKADMSSDVAEITVQAEFEADGDNVRTVVIRSNRSWFAHLDDLDHPIDSSDPQARVNWATLSVERHQNLTNTVDETEVVITFNENFSSEAINGVLNIWCEGKIVKSIPVTQKGRLYRVSAHTDIVQAKCDSDIVSVTVDCNTKWTARISAESTADVRLDVESGTGEGTLNVIFGENFSQTEEKTAEIIFSAKNCEDYALTISQGRAVPYVYILPEYDGRVLGGENQASIRIRSNADWTAEVVDSDFEDFTIVNQSGAKGTSEPQEVNVTFKANDSGDPKNIKTARIRFTAHGIDKPVEYVFRQRGTFVVSFEDMSAFGPEIPNTLNKGNTHPDPDNFNNNLCRPDRVNTDVDVFKYTSGNYSVDVELSQYIMYETSKSALYVIGAGKYPYIKVAGIEGLTIEEVSLGCSRTDAGYVYFAGNVVADDHILENAGKTTIEYTEYLPQVTWTSATDGSLHYIDFDLSEKGVPVEEGRGCTIRTSSKNGTTDTVNKTKMYVKTITFKYL